MCWPRFPTAHVHGDFANKVVCIASKLPDRINTHLPPLGRAGVGRAHCCSWDAHGRSGEALVVLSVRVEDEVPHPGGIGGGGASYALSQGVIGLGVVWEGGDALLVHHYDLVVDFCHGLDLWVATKYPLLCHVCQVAGLVCM